MVLSYRKTPSGSKMQIPQFAKGKLGGANINEEISKAQTPYNHGRQGWDHQRDKP